MSNDTFTNKHAVISGATGSIGFAIARRIVDEGGQVTLIGRREQPLQAAIATLGEAAAYHLVDVDDDQGVDSFCATLERVDLVICTAGWTVTGPVEDVPVADAVAMFNARFFGQCRLIRGCLPRMPERGIVLMCSGVGNRAFYPYYAYGAAVAGAIEGFAHHLAGELAPRKIRVNVISPGWTTPAEPSADFTERSQRAARRFAQEKEQRKAFWDALDSPLHETIPPEEFADALAFIARSSHYTGQVIRLDAGRSVTDKPLDGAVDPSSFQFRT